MRPDQSLLLLKPTGRVPHEGGKRFGIDSPGIRILKRWIEAGARPIRRTLPSLTGLKVTPRSQVLVEPVDRVQLKVEATFRDGTQTRRDARWPCFEPSAPMVRDRGRRHGDSRRRWARWPSWCATWIAARPVQLAFVPARPDFAWQDVPEANYIDRHVFAKLKTLRMKPSELCDDSVFLRRAYLDALGILPTADEACAVPGRPRVPTSGPG